MLRSEEGWNKISAFVCNYNEAQDGNGMDEMTYAECDAITGSGHTLIYY